MENFILEMKKIVDESKDDNLSNDSIRNKMTDANFNPEKEIIFSSGEDL